MKKYIQKATSLLLLIGITVVTFNLDVIKADPITEYQLEFTNASSVSNNIVTYKDGETISGTVNVYTQGETETPIGITNNGGHYETNVILNGTSYVLNTDASEGYQVCGVSIGGNPVNLEDINGDGEYGFNEYAATNDHVMVDINFATNCSPEGEGSSEPSDEYTLEFNNVSSVANNIVTYKDGEVISGTVNLYIQGETETPINITDNGGHYETSLITNGTSYVLNTDASEGYNLCGISINGISVASNDINGDGEYTFGNYNAVNDHVMIDVNFATSCTPEGPSNPGNQEEYVLEFSEAASVANNVVTYKDGETIAGTANLYIPGEPTTPINITNNGGHYETSSINNGTSYILNTDANDGYNLCSININGISVAAEDINGDGEYGFNDYEPNNSHIMVFVTFATNCNSGGSPEEPIESDLMVKIGENTIIDEENEIFVESAQNFTLTHEDNGDYVLNLTGNIGAIETTGNGTVIIKGNNHTIAANDSGYSIYTDGKSSIEYGIAGDDPEDTLFNLEGGIHYDENEFNNNLGMSITDVTMNIGTSENRSMKGIEIPGNVNIWFSEVNIYTTGYILDGVKDLKIVSGGELNGNTTGTAFNDMATSNVSVASGGIFNTTFATKGSSFNGYSSYYAPTTNIDSVHVDDITDHLIVFENGTHADASQKYTYTVNDTTFNLHSTAKKLFTISYGMDGISDTVVENGRVQILAGAGYSYADEDAETSTDYAIEEGTLVTIKLLPNYGYQYKSGGLNGNTTTAGASTGSYTFTMPANHLHLSAIFEAKDNVVDSETDKISGGNIQIDEADEKNYNGNLKLSIEENTDADEEDFTVEGYELGTVLDLTLDEVVYKNGNANEAWSNNITELDNEMNVTLELGDSLQGNYNYKVVRDHEGETTTLDAIYDEETGEITFATDQYSTYAIVYQAKEEYTATQDDFSITFEDGENQNFELTVSDLLNLTDEELEENEMTREEYNAVIDELKGLLEDYGTLVEFYDISVHTAEYDKTTGPLTFKMKLSDEMLKKYDTFKFVNIEISSGIEINEVITAEVIDGYLVVTLPHLSNYALVGSNTKTKVETEDKKIENPKTSDNIISYIYTCGGSMIILAGAYLYLKKY